MITYKVGNLVDAFISDEIDVLIHGCNCYCTMSAGIAKEIATKLPLAVSADKKTSPGNRSKLGSYSVAIYNTTSGSQKYIVNAYTQFTYWDKYDMLSYDAICKALYKFSREVQDKNLKIGMPFIGCGLAGGSWKIVSAIIETYLFEFPNVYVYALNEESLNKMTK